MLQIILIIIIIIISLERTHYLCIDSMSDLSDITSKFRTAAMFIIGDLYTVRHTEFVGMVMIFLHTTFRMPSSN
jgi:hypothetical protein